MIHKKYLDKYFNKYDDKYIVDSKIKSKVNFKRHDLILDSYEKDFDLILCNYTVMVAINDNGIGVVNVSIVI